jgi:hypothetical protein
MAKKPKAVGDQAGDRAADALSSAILANATAAAGGSAGQLPGDMQIRVDVHICLLDSMTDNFPIARPDILPTTVPSANPIGADSQGWGICLATYAGYLATLRPIYGFYVHQPAYTQDTLSKPVSEIITYLAKALVDQAKGLGA